MTVKKPLYWKNTSISIYNHVHTLSIKNLVFFFKNVGYNHGGWSYNENRRHLFNAYGTIDHLH
ncbi:hypothetical protein GCM10028778_16380 [Barrientosiimonas marina]